MTAPMGERDELPTSEEALADFIYETGSHAHAKQKAAKLFPMLALAQCTLPSPPAASADAVSWPFLIQKELQQVGELPCRVDEMTPREHLIFKMLASHNGFLQFMEAALRAPEADKGEVVAPFGWIVGSVARKVASTVFFSEEAAVSHYERTKSIMHDWVKVEPIYASPTDAGATDVTSTTRGSGDQQS